MIFYGFVEPIGEDGLAAEAKKALPLARRLRAKMVGGRYARIAQVPAGLAEAAALEYAEDTIRGNDGDENLKRLGAAH